MSVATCQSRFEESSPTRKKIHDFRMLNVSYFGKLCGVKKYGMRVVFGVPLIENRNPKSNPDTCFTSRINIRSNKTANTWHQENHDEKSGKMKNQLLSLNPPSISDILNSENSCTCMYCDRFQLTLCIILNDPLNHETLTVVKQHQRTPGRIAE